MDTVILASSLQSFALFVVAHALVLLILKNRHMLTGARLLYVIALAYNVYLLEHYPFALMLLSSLMLSLYIYAYYLCISHILFGTSLYVKLITMLDTASPKSVEDIRSAYGPKDILDAHLAQLIDAKKVRLLPNGRYALNKPKNIFLVSSVHKFLKDLINVSSR